MKKTIIIYGLAMAAGVFLLKFLEYRILIHELPITFYVGLIALFFTVIGVWAGLQFAGRKSTVTTSTAGVGSQSTSKPDVEAITRLGLSKRELDVLDLMSKGLSNQEIADSLFVSLNTVKTHSANLFVKLDVSRRTQAILKAKQLSLVS